MKTLAVWAVALALFVLLYMVGFLGSSRECLEWDGRACVQREVSPEITWPFDKDGKRTYDYKVRP